MNIITTIIWLFVLLFAITIHEASHGWAAYKMGDPTAASMGRISLNPIAHIDPIGTILFPLILILIGAPPLGWAKPVPVNPFNLRNPRRDNLWISAAGPASNLIAGGLALIVLLILKFASPEVDSFLKYFIRDYRGLPRGFYPLQGLGMILFYAVLTNIYLAVFNLIPVPPLDGSGVLMGLVSEEAAQKYDRLRPFGLLLILALVYLGVLDIIIRPIEIFISAILSM